MGRPAARLMDFHVCPMCSGPIPHVGGPIIAECAPTVLIGGMPAARVGDLAVCTCAVDSVATGSSVVMISGMLAARIGDSTVHGGVIVQGDFTVMIGDGDAGAGSGASSSADAPAAPQQEGLSAGPMGSLDDQQQGLSAGPMGSLSDQQQGLSAGPMGSLDGAQAPDGTADTFSGPIDSNPTTLSAEVYSTPDDPGGGLGDDISSGAPTTGGADDAGGDFSASGFSSQSTTGDVYGQVIGGSSSSGPLQGSASQDDPVSPSTPSSGGPLQGVAFQNDTPVIAPGQQNNFQLGAQQNQFNLGAQQNQFNLSAQKTGQGTPPVLQKETPKYDYSQPAQENVYGQVLPHQSVSGRTVSTPGGGPGSPGAGRPGGGPGEPTVTTSLRGEVVKGQPKSPLQYSTKDGKTFTLTLSDGSTFESRAATSDADKQTRIQNAFKAGVATEARNDVVKLRDTILGAPTEATPISGRVESGASGGEAGSSPGGQESGTRSLESRLKPFEMDETTKNRLELLKVPTLNKPANALGLVKLGVEKSGLGELPGLEPSVHDQAHGFGGVDKEFIHDPNIRRLAGEDDPPSLAKQLFGKTETEVPKIYEGAAQEKYADLAKEAKKTNLIAEPLEKASKGFELFDEVKEANERSEPLFKAAEEHDRLVEAGVLPDDPAFRAWINGRGSYLVGKEVKGSADVAKLFF